LPSLLENSERLFYKLGDDRRLDARVLDAIRTVRTHAKRPVWWPTSIIEPGEVVHPLRLVKSLGEIELLQRAADLSAEGHVAVMRAARPGVGEHELEAILLAAFRAGGARRPAYPPIVGSGLNATVLHYVTNDRTLESGELVLVDAGCEYQHYAADITRTFPVDGRFSEPQARIYDLVLDAQLAAIDRARVGASMDDVHLIAVRVLTEGLVRLGLVSGPVGQAVEEERFKPYYMHRTGHYLGLDVHDVGRYCNLGRPRPLEAGNVITVEPGIYVPADADVPSEYRGIGVRIEDDVLVTPDGPRTLTSAVAKRREDVERICGS
jgi:Xaa-Pro aminopeptidase